MSILFCSIGCLAHAQGSGVVWTEQTVTGLPPAVRLYKGERANPVLQAWYLDADLNDTSIAVRSYLSAAPGGKEGLAPFVHRVGAYGGINGGFFDLNSSTSYSAVVYPDEVKAQNIASVVRTSVAYPVSRSFFGITETRGMAVNWIYHFGNRVGDIFTFQQPLPNSEGTPVPVPDTTQGVRYSNLLVGIGGGPTLVKNGQVNVTYTPEVFWGSGVGETNRDPRTAVGYTANNHALMLVADGRSTASLGVSLPELAGIMIELGCVEAMNLDGGGSTQMAVGDSLINRPEGGTSMRAVPSILAVVHKDSLPLPQQVYFEKVIDTGDPEGSLIGSGWFPTANSGFWGTTPSQLHAKGTGEAYAEFRLGLTHPATYDLFAWWVDASNRCTDTPIIVKHQSLIDTVRVNQTTNGSRWYKIGSYVFNGESSEAVVVSDAATTGTYVVADAIRVISYDPSTTSSIEDLAFDLPAAPTLYQNYPNPFNPETEIQFGVPFIAVVRLAVFDLLGREVALLVDEPRSPGTYRVRFSGDGLASGIYVYRLSVGRWTSTSKMLLVR